MAFGACVCLMAYANGCVQRCLQVRIRILTYPELTNPEKKDMDVEQYGRLSRLPPLSVSKVFDGYRTLMRQLEEKRVYSKDRLETSASTGGCVVLDAVFPPTYGKSSLGIGLTEAEKQERTTKLNMWMAALLAKYAHCTPEAQELIHAFLSLDEDNPAEPANKTIHAVYVVVDVENYALWGWVVSNGLCFWWLWLWLCCAVVG